jgi:hypothetical protein
MPCAPVAARHQRSMHWTEVFTSRLNADAKLVGSTISCEATTRQSPLGTVESRANAHVQSYLAATDQVWGDRRPLKRGGRACLWAEDGDLDVQSQPASVDWAWEDRQRGAWGVERLSPLRTTNGDLGLQQATVP